MPNNILNTLLNNVGRFGAAQTLGRLGGKVAENINPEGQDIVQLLGNL